MKHSKVTFNLDLGDIFSDISIPIKKTAKVLNIILMENGQPYEIEKDCKVVFYAKKPNGDVLYNDCIVRDNVIEYQLTTQTIALAGIVECELLVYGEDSSNPIHSPSFTLVNYEPVFDGGEAIESTNEFTALTQAMGTLETLIDQAKDIVSSKSDDYTIHVPNYLTSKTSPLGIEFGTHVCAITEFDSTLPESDEEYTVQGTLEVIKAFDSIDCIRMYWYPFRSHNVYSRIPLADQNWSEWETAQSGGGVAESVVNEKIATAKRELIGAADDGADKDTIKGAKQLALDLMHGLEDKVVKTTELNNAINSALLQAKESGEFDGVDGKDGVNGDDGRSAYEIWLQQGNTGSETDFLESLKGDKGDPGEKGEQGIQGIQGIQGEKGDTGATGANGYTPQKGVDYWTEEDKEEINADNIAFISAELAKRGQLKPEFANNISECTDTSKLYVLPDGYIWAYMYTEVETGGYTNKAEPLPSNTTDTTKWVNGYRFSSSDISAQSGKTVSNYITCKNGDVIRIKGVTLESNVDRFCVYSTAEGSEKISPNYWNATNNFYTCELVNGVYVVTLKSYQNYVIHDFRFAMTTPTDASAVIVTVNEEIIESTVTQEYAWTNTNHAFVPNDYDEEFVEIKKDIKQLKLDAVDLKNKNTANEKSIEALEAKIENIGETEIPDYWQGHITEKITAIKNLHKQYGKDCFSFVVLADTHYPANLGKISPLLAKKIMDNTDIKYAILAGDWQTRSCHKTKEALLEENAKIDAMFAPIRERLLMQQGNHDGAYGTLDRNGDGSLINQDANGNPLPVEDRETYVHNLTHGEMHEYIYRKVGMVGNVHFDRTGTAYYIDDTSNNVRYIGLNTQCNDYELQADGTQKYPKMWIMRFTQSQFDFLINKALKGLDDETKVVLFGHVPLTQEIGDRDVMNGVLKAFKNKTTYSGNYTGEYPYDAVSVDADFSNAKGTLVGYFHGHIHSDSLNTTNGFPIIGTRSDAVEEYAEELRNERVLGTITEQSFNVFTVTPNTIYATKIGAGTDRQISY